VLADVHQRAKKSKRRGHDSISEGCTTTYMPPIGADPKTGTGIKSQIYWATEQAPDKPMISPFLLFGLDLTEHAQILARAFQAAEAGHPIDNAEHQRLHEEAKRRMFEPPSP
jgi:hypothetical protein